MTGKLKYVLTIILLLCIIPILNCKVSAEQIVQEVQSGLNVVTNAPNTTLSLTGSGSQNDPYLIKDANDLVWLSTNNKLFNGFSKKYFKQTANIFINSEWIPIGDESTPFLGTYDGGMFIITGLSITTSSLDKYQGLFGYIGSNSLIRNIGVDVNINGQGRYVGGLVGFCYGGKIVNCYCSGSVKSYNTDTYSSVGGLVAGYYGQMISNCFTTCSVTGSSNFVGGLVGYNSQGTITNSYTSGPITGNGSSQYYSAGGLVGCNYYGIITNCYSISIVKGVSNIGGLTGSNMYCRIYNCFAAGTVSGSSFLGGIAGGDLSSTVYNCYYVSNQANDGTFTNCAQRLSLDFYKSVSTYTTISNWYINFPWDFINTWGIDQSINNGYPYLKNSSIAPVSTPTPPPAPINLSLPSPPAIAKTFGGGLALHNDGTVIAWGNSSYLAPSGSTSNYGIPVPLNGFKNVVAVAGAGASCFVLKSDGTIWAWGKNDAGQLGNGSTENSNVPAQVYGLSNIVNISAGNNTVYALKSDGTVWSWGNNEYGQLGNDSTEDSYVPVQVVGLTGIKSISAGGYDAYALKSDGTVWSWGNNNTAYALGNGSPIYMSSVPVQVYGLTHITAITAGDSCGYALKDDGTVWSWGYNYFGQLGNGTSGVGTYSAVPVKVNGLSDVIAISAGSASCYALKSDGTVFGWGYDYDGRLGNGATPWITTTPVQAVNLSDIIAIAGSEGAFYAMKKDGSVWAFGYNAEGQLGNGSQTNSSVPIQVHGLYDAGYLNLLSPLPPPEPTPPPVPTPLPDQTPISIPPIQLIGTGTEADPYLITNLDDLDWVKTNNVSYNGFPGKYFKQTDNIDVSSIENWTPIGNDSIPFKGIYDGNRYTVSGLKYRGDSNSFGLFGSILSATIKNIGVINLNINSSGAYIGGLVGSNSSGLILNCYCTGDVQGWGVVGGLVGANNGIINNSYSKCNVNGNYDIGGLVGACYSGTIKNSYSTGNVIGSSYSGGLIGHNDGTLINCYSTSTVTGWDYNGGFVGINSGTIKNCYCVDIHGRNGVGAKQGLSNIISCTLQADILFYKTASSYLSELNWDSTNSWDFTKMWAIDSNAVINDGYPYLLAPVNITSIKVNDKIYDGTNVTSINSASVVLNGVHTGDEVRLDTTTATVSFSNKNVGTNKPVTITGLKLCGADANKYILTQPAGLTANIEAKVLTPLVKSQDKVYDGNTNATVSVSLNGIVGNEDVSVTCVGTYADKNVGADKTVNVTNITLGGNNYSNYVLSNASASVTANITAKTLIPSVTAQNKVYDGNTNATCNITLSGIVGTDDVTAIGTAVFEDPYVGTGKTVNVNGIILSGSAKDNYTLSTTSAKTTANITPKAITLSVAQIGTTNYSTLSAALAAASNGDTINLLCDFTESVTGADKTVTIRGGGHTITAKDGGSSVALTLSGTGTVTLNDLTLYGGTATSYGCSKGLQVSDSFNVKSLGTVNAIGGTGDYSVGVENEGTGTVNVTTAIGGKAVNTTNDQTYSYGVSNDDLGTVNVTTATGGTATSPYDVDADSYSYGVCNGPGTVNVTAATGGTVSSKYDSLSYGVYNDAGGTVNVATATGGNATCSSNLGNGYSYGVYNNLGRAVNVTNASGGTASYDSYGVFVEQGAVNVTNASGGTAVDKSYGVFINNYSAKVNVRTGTTNNISNTNFNVTSLQLNKGTDSSCVLDSIIVAASGSTAIGVLPSVYRNGVFSGAWYTDSSLTMPFTSTTVVGATILYSATNAENIVPVSSIGMGKSNTTIISGKSEQLTAAISPDNASDKTVTWSIVSSSAVNVATVDQNGLVTANNSGTVVIRATSNADSTKYADCSVKVVAANTIYSVKIGTTIGGSIASISTSTVAGATINITVTPYSGMKLKAGTLKYNDGSNDYPINGTSFIMSASNITVTGQFEQIPGYTVSSESDFIFSNGTILGYKGAGGNVIIPST